MKDKSWLRYVCSRTIARWSISHTVQCFTGLKGFGLDERNYLDYIPVTKTSKICGHTQLSANSVLVLIKYVPHHTTSISTSRQWMTPTAQDVLQKYLDSDLVYKQYLHVLQLNGLLCITQEKSLCRCILHRVNTCLSKRQNLDVRMARLYYKTGWTDIQGTRQILTKG